MFGAGAATIGGGGSGVRSGGDGGDEYQRRWRWYFFCASFGGSMGIEFDAALCLNRPRAAHRKTCVEGLGFRIRASYFIGAFGLSEESAQPQEKSIGGGSGGVAAVEVVVSS